MEHPLWLARVNLHDHLNNKFEYTITREYLEKDVVSYLNQPEIAACGQTLNILMGPIFLLLQWKSSGNGSTKIAFLCRRS